MVTISVPARSRSIPGQTRALAISRRWAAYRGVLPASASRNRQQPGETEP